MVAAGRGVAGLFEAIVRWGELSPNVKAVRGYCVVRLRHGHNHIRNSRALCAGGNHRCGGRMDGMTGVVEELDNARAHIAALLGVLVEYEAAHDAMRARGDAMVAEWRELAQAHGLHVVGDTTRVVLRCERCGVRFAYVAEWRQSAHLLTMRESGL